MLLLWWWWWWWLILLLLLSRSVITNKWNGHFNCPFGCHGITSTKSISNTNASSHTYTNRNLKSLNAHIVYGLIGEVTIDNYLKITVEPCGLQLSKLVICTSAGLFLAEWEHKLFPFPLTNALHLPPWGSHLTSLGSPIKKVVVLTVPFRG